jgi:hypothetical protein
MYKKPEREKINKTSTGNEKKRELSLDSTVQYTLQT